MDKDTFLLDVKNFTEVRKKLVKELSENFKDLLISVLQENNLEYFRICGS